LEKSGYPEAKQAKELLNSIIETALFDPKSWLKIRELSPENLDVSSPSVTDSN
jgi:hypothetical protein